MNIIPFDFRCSACGRRSAVGESALCALCGAFLCHDHIATSTFGDTCERCAAQYERASAGARPAADHERLVTQLCADVAATIGPGHDRVVVQTAARHRLYARDPAAYVSGVVDDVQQFFHDTFVDTTWPSCPHHRNHPLWFSDGSWRCQQLERVVADLGDLEKVQAGPFDSGQPGSTS